MIAVEAIQWTAGSFLIAVVVIGIVYLLSRSPKHRRFRVGVFVERERFAEDEAEKSRKEVRFRDREP